MTITPDMLARSGREDGEQTAVFCYAAIEARSEPLWALLFAIPNGGSRGDTKRSRMIRGAQLKAQGVKKGVPDMMLPVARAGFHGLYIELKRVEQKATDIAEAKLAGVTSDDQDSWHVKLSDQGYCVIVAYGWLEAVTQISSYLRMEPFI